MQVCCRNEMDGERNQWTACSTTHINYIQHVLDISANTIILCQRFQNLVYVQGMAMKMDCYDKSPYGSDRIFHWVPPEYPSDPMPSSPSDPKLRRYTTRICKFASDSVGLEAVRIPEQMHWESSVCLYGQQDRSGCCCGILAPMARIVPHQGKLLLTYTIANAAPSG